VFIFGTIYTGSALQGAKLILLENGLYSNDWSAFGAFVAAPVGGLLWGAGALAVRLGVQYIRAKIRHERFEALDKPAAVTFPDADGEAVASSVDESGKSGRFF